MTLWSELFAVSGRFRRILPGGATRKRAGSVEEERVWTPVFSAPHLAMDSQNPAPYSFDAVHSGDLGGAPVLDEATFGALQELAGDDDPDLIQDLIGLFLEDSAQRMGAMGEAIGSGDAATIASAAHALKSSGANIGALEFSSTCASLERSVRSEGATDMDALEVLVTRALRLYEEVCQALGQPAS